MYYETILLCIITVYQWFHIHPWHNDDTKQSIYIYITLHRSIRIGCIFLRPTVSTLFDNHISMIYFWILSIVGVIAVVSIYDLECIHIFNLTPLRLTLYHHILYIVICIYWGIRRCLHAYSIGIDENIQT